MIKNVTIKMAATIITQKKLPLKYMRRVDTKIFPTTMHFYTQLTSKPFQQRGCCDQNPTLQGLSVIHIQRQWETSKTTLTKPETDDS